MGNFYRISFWGLNGQGRDMACNLAQSGYEVTVLAASICPDDCEKTHCDLRHTLDARESVSGAHVLLNMLEDFCEFQGKLHKLHDEGGLPDGLHIIHCGDATPQQVVTLGAWARGHGYVLIDAPSTGGALGAKQASLSFAAGGDAIAIANCAPIFGSMGHVTRVGEIGSGQICRLGNQAIAAVFVGVFSEVMALVKASGGDAEAFRSALRSGFNDNRLLTLMCERVMRQNFSGGASAESVLSDLQTGVDVASQFGLTMPLMEKAEEAFSDLVHREGRGADNYAAISQSKLLVATEKA